MKQEEKTQDSFPSELLDEALFYLFDLMQDAQLEYFLMGKTAEQIVKGEWLTGTKLEFGIKKNQLTKDTLDVLKFENPGIDIQDRKIIMEYKGVPIEIKVIKLHYRVLDNLDAVDYAYESFLVPNPFDAFMRMSNFMH